MIKLLEKASILLLLTMLSISAVSQSEWNQFRGPDRSGIADGKIEVSEWNGNNLDLVWKHEVGSAFSELIFENNIMYTMISEIVDSVSGSEFVAAFDEKTGKLIWKSRVDSIYFDEDNWGDGSRATPVYDEENIYSLSGHGKLTATSKKDGKQKWQVNIKKDFGSTTPRWGYATSPLLFNNTVIMEVGGTDSRAFAGFNPEDGSVKWTSGNGMSSHDSPLLTTIDGQDQIIFANGNILYSYTSEGDTLWTFKLPMARLTAMPLKIDDNKIFLSGVRNPGFFIIQVEDNKPNQILTGNTMKNDFSSCVYHDGFIYGFNVAAVRCISAETGEAKWTKRGYGKGALMMVDGKLVIISDKGKLIIVEATPEKYTELATVQAVDGKSWTAPSFNNGRIYVRNLTQMACYSIK